MWLVKLLVYRFLSKSDWFIIYFQLLYFDGYRSHYKYVITIIWFSNKYYDYSILFKIKSLSVSNIYTSLAYLHLIFVSFLDSPRLLSKNVKLSLSHNRMGWVPNWSIETIFDRYERHAGGMLEEFDHSVYSPSKLNSWISRDAVDAKSVSAL